MTAVPFVDLSGWERGDAAERARIAASLDVACREVGFMQVRGHGISSGVLAEAVAATDAFFALPLSTKLQYRPPRPEINRGYTAVGTESLSYSLGVDTPPDLFEAFNVGVPAPPSPADDPVMFAPNISPAELPELVPALETYLGEARAAAGRILRVMAVALGEDERFFEDKTDRSLGTLRVNHYHRRGGEPDPVEGQMRMGAHTDYGILTVLYADPVPGLQIVGPGGEWFDVIPEPGSVLVNLGDALALWTNDHWRSTLHRVVPPAGTGPAVRRSFAYFHDGNLDAVVTCVASCQSPDDPPRYAPITLGDHLLAKILGPRTRQDPGTVQTVAGRPVA